MQGAFETHPVAMKFLRITLVFMLVFWSSFGLESLAFGEPADALAPEDVIEKISLYEADEEAPEGLGTLVRDTADNATQTEQFYVPAIDERGGTKTFVAVATVHNAEGEVRTLDVSELMDWALGETTLATFDATTRTLTPAEDCAGGEVELTATLQEAYLTQVDPTYSETYPETPFAVGFRTSIVSQIAPYVTSIQILGSEGADVPTSETDGAREVTLEPEQGGYTFQAKVEVFDPLTGETTTYTSTPEQGLEQQTEGVIPNLVWHIDEARSATMDGTGTLTMNEDTQVIVHCSSTTTPPEGESATDAVRVKKGEQLEPYVTSVQVLGTEGGAIEGRTLELAEGQDTYQFGLSVEVFNPNDASTTTYTFANGAWQASTTGTGATDVANQTPATLPFQLNWSVTQAEDSENQATIDSNGLLVVANANAVQVMCSVQPAQNGGSLEDAVTVNPPKEPEPEPEEPEKPEELRVAISYVPVPEGQTAVLSAYPVGMHGFTYYLTWEQLQEDGSWKMVEDSGDQVLQIPTAEPYLNKSYRARVEVIAVDTAPAELVGTVVYSAEETIRIGDGINIALFVKYVPEGETALFTTDIRGTVENRDQLIYVWEESSDEGNTWDVLATGYLPSYSILTEKPRYGHQFRVRLKETEDGPDICEPSNIQMLAANAPYEPSNGTNPEDPNAPAQGDSTGNATEEKTLSQEVDEAGSVRINVNDRQATMRSVESVDVETPEPETEEPQETPQPTEQPAQEQPKKQEAQQPQQNEPLDIKINEKASAEIAEQKRAEQEQINQTEPGARWNPIYPLNQEEDLTKALDENPFNRLVAPFCLALVASGAVEKRYKFKEQTRKPIELSD